MGTYANSAAITGNSYEYNVSIYKTGASTTGNVYGIYDMVGTIWENVMATYNGSLASSRFNVLPDHKYYDNYTTLNLINACGGII